MISNRLMLFTDGSVNTKSKTGYGAYLVVQDVRQSLDALSSQVKVKQFENTSSTKLELQTMLWALNDIKESGKSVIVYTDSQNIMGLPGRRKRLERAGYRSKNNTILKNHELYKAFYALIDQISCDFIQIRGHQSSKHKDDIDRIFTLVDRASRHACRNKTSQAVGEGKPFL